MLNEDARGGRLTMLSLPEQLLDARQNSFTSLGFGWLRLGRSWLDRNRSLRPEMAKDISIVTLLDLGDFLRRHRPCPHYPVAPYPVVRLAFEGPASD